ncbi:MAG: UDP-glucose 4-epimerase GalE [Bacteroidota bacterium]|nr:UDP-glucose 4-epimerase GalE [Bacteroidota bacterium]
MSRQKILITGGAGYIGSHTITEIIENTDHEVVSIDNFSNSSENVFSKIEKITGKKVKNYSIDLCDKDAVETIFKTEKDITGVIHFAAFKSVPESVSNPNKYYQNNINSLLNVLESCIKFNVSDFIFSSSCSVYGNIDDLPVKETTELKKPESPYAYTKQVGEEILKDYVRAFPVFQTIALRYFNPVGAHVSGLLGEAPLGKPNNLVPIITQTATGKIKEMTVYGNDYPTRDGSCIRDYVHVTDIAIAHLKALDYLSQRKNIENFSVFNLGTGSGVSVLEAIQTFEKISKLKLNYKVGPKRPGDVCAIYSDTTLSEKELGWKPRFSLEEMIETAWKWELNMAKD